MRVFSTLLVMIGLAACTSMPNPEGKPAASLTFSHLKPVQITAASIEVVNNYQPVADKPYKRPLPMTPETAMQRYLGHRYTTKDDQLASNIFRFEIKNASIVQEKRKSDSQVLATLNLDNTEDYTLKLAVGLENTSATGAPLTKTALRYERVKSFPASLSPAEFDAQYLLFIEETIKELDQAIINSLDKNFRVIDPIVPKTFFSDLTQAPDSEGAKAQDIFTETYQGEEYDGMLPNSPQREKAEQPPMQLKGPRPEPVVEENTF